MDVSIIIVNYNTAALLINCIDSIQQKTVGITYEIIVVDNNSTDNSVKQLKEKSNDITIIESPENIGFGKGNNLGAKYSKGKYLFLLNSDTLLINNAIKLMFDFIELPENKNIACVGGNLYHLDGRPNYSYSISFPSLLGIIRYRSGINKLLGSDYYNTTEKPKSVAIIIGADMLISKEKFDLINGFDPEYFMYVEEGDLQYRFSQISLKSYSFPAAKIMHLQGASSTMAFKLKSEVNSYLIYFNKFHSKNTVFIYKKIELFFFTLKYIYFTIKQNKHNQEQYADAIVHIRSQK